MGSKKSPIYVLYKGDSIIDMGTEQELAERRGVKPETIRWYTYPSAKARNKATWTTVVRVDDSDS